MKTMGSLILIWLFFLPVSLWAQDWYRSNPAGMALEKTPSRMVALHNEWALSVERAGSNALPAMLRSYYHASYTLEQRLLYERGILKRRQWIFRDPGGQVRVNASLPADLSSVGAGTEKGESAEVAPFVELFGPGRTLTETHHYLASGKLTTRYLYRDELLVKAETFLDNVPLWTDAYRYTRSFLLRGVERNYHKAGTSVASLQGTSAELGVSRTGANSQPPALLTNLDLRETPPVPDFMSIVSPHNTSIMNDVLGSIYAVIPAKVIYDTDSQGRVIRETRYNTEGKILAEITNEWTGDRITLIRWSASLDEGRIVFRYSGKNRISEEDYRNGVLERRVNVQGDEEIEEIFMNNKVILRAVWKDGRKVSEERVPFNEGAPFEERRR